MNGTLHEEDGALCCGSSAASRKPRRQAEREGSQRSHFSAGCASGVEPQHKAPLLMQRAFMTRSSPSCPSRQGRPARPAVPRTSGTPHHDRSPSAAPGSAQPARWHHPHPHSPASAAPQVLRSRLTQPQQLHQLTHAAALQQQISTRRRTGSPRPKHLTCHDSYITKKRIQNQATNPQTAVCCSRGGASPLPAPRFRASRASRAASLHRTATVPVAHRSS